MNKPSSIRQFLVFDKVEYLAKESIGVKPIQILTLKLIGNRMWLNISTNKVITLRSTNIKHHYLAIGKDNKEYILSIQY